MRTPPITTLLSDNPARHANAAELATLLQDSRARTLALADAYAAALGAGMPVPYSLEVNPPLWELGHIGWFQEYWIARNPQHPAGHQADPDCARSPSILGGADALYDSGKVTHATRWNLPLPDLTATQAYLSAGLQTNLEHLRYAPETDASLYFYRLALFHEDMHAEAAVYMAQALGLALPDALQTRGAVLQTTHAKRLDGDVSALSERPLSIAAGDFQLGVDLQASGGFAFDNELNAATVQLPAFEIDARPVSWRRYLANETAASLPRYVRKNSLTPALWEHCHFGQWKPLDLDAPACHLTYPQVLAWCQWAGRQLPTEAQWECAALTQPDFQWGQVWEWTASTFTPYPGFSAHPYRDYSAPWFGSRPVLRGACRATAHSMVHPRYRNFFTPERSDIYAGFRTCSVTG